MILTTTPVPTEEQLQPVLELLSPQYQEYAIWFLGAITTAYVIYTVIIKPLQAASKTAKELIQQKILNQELKDNINNLTEEDINNIVNKSLSDAEILLLKSEISKLKVSLSLTNDPIVQADIQLRINEIQAKLDENV